MALPWKALAKEFRRVNIALGVQNDMLHGRVGMLCSEEWDEAYDTGFYEGYRRAAASVFGLIGMAEAIAKNDAVRLYPCSGCGMLVDVNDLIHVCPSPRQGDGTEKA